MGESATPTLQLPVVTTLTPSSGLVSRDHVEVAACSDLRSNGSGTARVDEA
jgi:hypothetical protein